MSEASGMLVVRNDRLGDTILALPTVAKLKQEYPSERIFFWSSPAVAPLISCVDGVERVFAATDAHSKELIPALRKADLKTAYCLRPTLSNAWTLFRAGIPTRVGTSRRWYSALFNRRVNLRRRGMSLHEADLNLRLAGFDASSLPAVFPAFNLPMETSRNIDDLLKVRNLDTEQSYIVIHPGSGGSARNWPPEYFRTLAGLLAAETNLPVLITGGTAEKDLTARVADGHHIDLGGAVNLVELACLLSRASLVVSNSTGPLHLAVALGVKVVGLYPPVVDCLPERWGPYGQPEGAIMPDLPLCKNCQPGVLSPCRCMESLKPATVFERCLSVLGSIR